MGVLDWVNKVVDGIDAATDAIGIKLKPSSLIPKARDILPAVVGGALGIGPVLPGAVTAAEAIYGGNASEEATKTSTPTEESVEPTRGSPPDFSQMEETLSSAVSAINKNRTLLRAKFDEQNKKLDDLNSRFDGIDSHLATLQSKLEGMRLEEHAVDRNIEHELKVLKLQMEKSLLQNDDLKLRMNDFNSMYVERERHDDRLELEKQYGDLANTAHTAIEYLKDNLGAFHKINIQDNDPSKILPYFNSSKGTSLPIHCSHLQDGISNLRNYIRSGIPTQEVLDLYVFAVTWLLTYHKAVITLRSYLAHGYMASHQFSEYTKTISQWNDDLHHLVHDARENADFLLGTKKAGKGLIEELAEARLGKICPREAYEDKALGHVTYFYDRYPSYGVGFSELSFTKDRGDRGTIVIKVGHSNPGGLNSDIDALRQGYIGIQGSTFTTATAAAVEMAKVWRSSVELWESRMPFNPKNAAPLVNAIPKVSEVLATTKNLVQEGPGYRTGQYVTYGVSYVTNFGEGYISWMAKPTCIEKDGQFIEIKLNPLEGVRDTSLDFLSNNELHPAVVRRVYVKVTGGNLERERVFHVADRSGLLTEGFTILDQAAALYPKGEDKDED